MFVAAQGVVMVDSMLPGNGATLLRRVKSVTDKPVIKNVEPVIGGHTPTLVTRNDFKEYTEFYDDFFNSAQTGLRGGKSVDDIVNAYKVPARFKGFVATPAGTKANAQAIADKK